MGRPQFWLLSPFLSLDAPQESRGGTPPLPIELNGFAGGGPPPECQVSPERSVYRLSPASAANSV